MLIMKTLYEKTMNFLFPELNIKQFCKLCSHIIGAVINIKLWGLYRADKIRYVYIFFIIERTSSLPEKYAQGSKRGDDGGWSKHVGCKVCCFSSSHCQYTHKKKTLFIILYTVTIVYQTSVDSSYSKLTGQQSTPPQPVLQVAMSSFT